MEQINGTVHWKEKQSIAFEKKKKKKKEKEEREREGIREKERRESWKLEELVLLGEFMANSTWKKKE